MTVTGTPSGRIRTVLAMAFAAIIVFGGLVVGPASAGFAADVNTDGHDGLQVQTLPERLTKGDQRGFTLTITDENLSNVAFETYDISGIPEGWKVSANGETLVPVSPHPVIYRIDRSTSELNVVPSADFSGTLEPVRISRVSNERNLVTDFDHGTFDYLGEGLPVLASEATPYEHHNPLETTGVCGSVQYSPCDGQYSIWPTALFSGPDLTEPWHGKYRPYNNYWADLRSTTNAMVTPTTQEITENWNAPAAHFYAMNTRNVELSESVNAGKLLVVNGSRTLPQPHDVLTTVVSGLEPNSDYTIQGYVANVSDYPRDDREIAPVQVGFVVNDKFIGTSNESPKQRGAESQETVWTPITSVINTGDSTSIKFGVRSYAKGGWGNDFAIDELSLKPFASATVALTVDEAGYEFSKESDPVSGEQVMPGQEIRYTLRGVNTGKTVLSPVVVNDDLSDVLQHADVLGDPVALVDGKAAGEVTVKDAELSWSGELAPGESVVITYSVKLHSGEKAPWGVQFKNHATSVATPPGEVPPLTPPPGETTHEVPVPGYEFSKESDPVSGEQVMPGQEITYTLRGVNTGKTVLSPVVVNDDLSDVLQHADVLGDPVVLVDGKAAGEVTVKDAELSWSGELAPGESVVITYSVKLHSGEKAPWGVQLKNHATSVATPPGEVPPLTPPPGETTHHVPVNPTPGTTTNKVPQKFKHSEIAHTGSQVAPLMLGGAVVVMAGAIVLAARNNKRTR